MTSLDRIEWSPEEVSRAARDCDQAGEVLASSKELEISGGGFYQDLLSHKTDAINELLSQMTFIAAGITQAIKEVNTGFIRAEEENISTIRTNQSRVTREK